MAQVSFRKGKSTNLAQQPLKDGAITFTVDDGRIHLDYLNQNDQIIRKTFYSGKLTFGAHTYDGTTDVNVAIYEGNLKEDNSNG